MAFSTGQFIFGVLFLVVFVSIIIMQYRKDKKLHLKNYRDVKWVLITFIIFLILLFVIKHFLKN